MLRSRGNRQQRPSESSDERNNNSGGASYGGYPGGGGMMGVASGADDDYSYSGGYGNNRSGYAYANSNKKSYNNNNTGYNKNVWDRKAMGSTIKGGPKGSNNGSSAGLILLAATFIMTCFMGGMTLHYRKANDRMEHELMIVRRKMKMGGGRGGGHLHRPHHDDDDDDDSVQNNNGNDNNNVNTLTPRNPKEHELMIELAKLSSQRQELQAEKHTWEARTKSLEHEITAYESQINHLTNGEIKSYQTQLSTISQGLQNEQIKAENYKKAFVKMHSTGETGMLTPRAGPGHTLTQRKEIENMDSLDDYEDYVQRREDALWDKIDLLVDKLGRESRREAIEWFGPGPHRVEMTISYPKYDPDKEPADWPIARGVFLLEMAPLDKMPIAVNLFLQQVHHKLWNNCSFVINAMHILQAGPHRYTEGGQYDANLDELISKFENARLDKMPFQEYHAEFPHEQWTVGFAGRPGGPDFYINKIDNSVNHGPGGQTHHDLHEEADPAFAKLVSGMEIIKDLNRIPVDYDKGALLLHPVVILDSKVIASNCDEGCWRE